MKLSILSAEIAAAAARLIVEAGMEYGPAKRKAARLLGGSRASALPDNDAVEDEVRAYLDLFRADTQPAELSALRDLAEHWMRRLADFRPHLCGAVWRGTATRLNPIRLQLYCDDAKAAEIALINLGLRFEVETETGPRGDEVDLLVLQAPCQALGEPVTICLAVLDHDDLRGALRSDARGRTERGDLAALRRLRASEAT